MLSAVSFTEIFTVEKFQHLGIALAIFLVLSSVQFAIHIALCRRRERINNAT